MSHDQGSVPDITQAVDWRDTALCRTGGFDPEEFFPSNGTNGSVSAAVRHAQAICHGCPSRLPCGQWALDRRIEHGVWGGLSEADRRAILRRRGKQAAA